MTSPSFFLNGLAALFVLFLLTLLMEPAPIVDALRAFIGVGAVIVVLKMVHAALRDRFPAKKTLSLSRMR